MDTTIYLNILPLGSYENLIGTDRIESHKTVINCLHKTFDCIDEKGNYHTIKGIYIPISIRQISAMQLKICIMKGFHLYAIKIVENELEKLKTNIRSIPYP